MKLLSVFLVTLTLYSNLSFASSFDLTKQNNQTSLINACKGKSQGEIVKIYDGSDMISATCTLIAVPKADKPEKSSNLWD